MYDSPESNVNLYIHRDVCFQFRTHVKINKGVYHGLLSHNKKSNNNIIPK